MAARQDDYVNYLWGKREVRGKETAWEIRKEWM